MQRVMEENDIKMIPQGFITGISGGILNECLIRKIRGITLLVKANETLIELLPQKLLEFAVQILFEFSLLLLLFEFSLLH